MRSVTKHISQISTLPFNTCWNLFLLVRIIGSKHYYKWTTDNLPFKDGICFYLKARQFSPTQDCLEIHMLKNSPMLGPMPGSRCIMGCHCDTHSNYELWIIWDLTTPAAAMLVLRPARQAKSVCWWLVGVASNSCTLLCAPQYPPPSRAFQSPAEVQRWCFDSRDQNLIGFSAGANLQATHLGSL